MSTDKAASLALRASRTENLGLLPQVAAKVVQLTQNSDVSLDEIELLVGRDVALAGKLMKVANSSYYGGQNVRSIRRAAATLGLTQVRNITMTVAYQQISTHKPSAKHFNAEKFWGHSLGVAILARNMSRQLGIGDPDEVYLLGLLHDIGILMLDRMSPELLDTALATANQENRPLFIIEQRLFGFDHGELGAAIVEQWGFERKMSNPIRFHHDWAQDREFSDRSAVLHVANALAHGNGLLNQGVAVDMPLDAMQKLDINPAVAEAAVAELVMELTDAQAAFSVRAA